MFVLNSLQDLQERPALLERDRSLSQKRHLTVCHNTNRIATGRKLFKQHGHIGTVYLRLQESMWHLLPGGPKTCFCVKELISNTKRQLCRFQHNPNRIFFPLLFLSFKLIFLMICVADMKWPEEKWKRILIEKVCVAFTDNILMKRKKYSEHYIFLQLNLCLGSFLQLSERRTSGSHPLCLTLPPAHRGQHQFWQGADSDSCRLWSCS